MAVVFTHHIKNFSCGGWGHPPRQNDANINSDGTLIVITTTKGKVELRKDNGHMVRIMSSDAVSARFSGTDIVITTAKGKTEIRKENGNLIRVF